jgi:hypothetical protein
MKITRAFRKRKESIEELIYYLAAAKNKALELDLGESYCDVSKALENLTAAYDSIVEKQKNEVSFRQQAIDILRKIEPIEANEYCEYRIQKVIKRLNKKKK